MKKLFAVLVALVLCLPLSCLAEVDLSQMTFDELVALKDQINLALWSSDEWQEVLVPQGIYKVGESIPAGKWNVKAADGAHAWVEYGTSLNKYKSGISLDGVNVTESLTSENYSSFDKNIDKPETVVDLQDGWYIVINWGNVIFTPYSGLPDLGFKK